MSAVSQYAYLHTRVSVMTTRLLSPAQLDNLIQNESGSESELLQAAGLIGLPSDEPATPPVSLEQRLITLELADFVILVRALSGAARDFLLYYAYRFELSNLKTILRGKLTGQSPMTIREQLVNMGPFAQLPVEDLLQTEDVAEMLRRLERTPFGNIARRARSVYEEHREQFALDAAVDRRYFAGLSKRAHEADCGREPHLRALVGAIIDHHNLMWLLRYRFAFNLSPAETYYLLIPASYRLSSQQLLALSQLGSMEEVIRHLPRPFMQWLEGAKTAFDVTRILEREEWRLAESVLRRTSFNLARVFAYLMLRNRDLQRLRAVIKGKRLKIKPEQIREAAGLAAAG